MAKGNKAGKTGQSQKRPTVEDPEETMNSAMMKKKPAQGKKHRGKS